MTLQFQLPDELSKYAQRRAAELGYRDASEYLAAVLEADQRRHLSVEIDELIAEAADGPFDAWTQQDVDDVRDAGRRIIEQRRSS